MTDNSKKPNKKHYLGCLIKGQARLKSAKKELLLKEGEIFYIPKDFPYQSLWYLDESGRNEFYSFGFDFLPTDKSYELQKIEPSPKAQVLFDELCREMRNDEKKIGLLYHFLGEAVGGMKRARKPSSNPIIESVIEIMQEQPHLKIGEIAKRCNISESGLYALFQRKLHQTPNEMRNKILCEHAAFLLATTDQSVQEISERLGFSSPSYFRKVLKAQIGKTPLAIRKESTAI